MTSSRSIASVAGVLLFVSSACLAQGSATPWEVRGIAQAAELIGSSAVVRGAIQRLVGPTQARALFGLPASEFGLRVINADDFARAVALDPIISKAGQTEAFLASINSLRSLTAQAPGAGRNPTSTLSTLDLLSVSNSRSFNWAKDVGSATVAQKIVEEPAKRKIALTAEGVKVDPGFSIPLWSTGGTSGQLVLDNVKWSQLVAGGTVVCALASPCAGEISERLKKIVGSQPAPN